VNEPRWRPAYVGIGSNLESPQDQVNRALVALGGIGETLLVRSSPLYRSAPLDGSEQPDYINAVSALLTRLDADALLESLHGIERAQGRTRDGDKWGPRTLDLDLLVYSGDLIDKNDLKVPHPGIAERNFVLLPLVDIAPHLRIPGLGSVSGLAAGADTSNPRIEKLTKSIEKLT
jgi:2-amino-4-hydroxy-6-hydroxymethyldihydropteridine diphosphokinase